MIKQRIKRLLIFIFIINMISLNFISVAYGKEQRNFKSITIKDGLTQGTVEALFQDSKGYMWFGTNDGLNRYNGYEFKTFRVEEGKRNSIVNNYILDINEDKEGNIWIATAYGVSKIHNDGKTITNYLEGKDNGNLSHGNANCIVITKDNEIFIATKKGINVYDEKADSFKLLFSNNELVDKDINWLTIDNENNLWAAAKESGLFKVNLDSETIEKIEITNSNNDIKKDNYYKVYYDYKGYIWVSIYEKGIYKIKLDTMEVKKYYYGEKYNNSLPGKIINYFFRDKNGSMWIASENGLVKYDDEKDSFTANRNKVYDIDSIIDDNIYSIIQDTTGLIWIGTYSGVSMFNPNTDIIHYKNDPFDDKTITDNMITAIYEDDGGFLWVGNKNKGIDILDENIDKITTISEKNGLSSNHIFDIVGNENEIYLATNQGVNVINKENKTIKKYTIEDGLPSDSIRRLLYDDLGYLWIGTVEGLAVLSLESNKIINLVDVIEKYSPDDNYIGDIYKDSDGEYWIGTFINGGLIRINTKNKKVNVYKSILDDNKSISNDIIRYVTEDEKGDIWIGTSLGVNKFSKKDNIFHRYTTKDGLANNTVYGILFDNDGNPWCATNVGISKIDLKTELISNFDVIDGLQSNEFNGNAYFKNKNGDLFFGGINGFNIINPDKIVVNDDIDNLIIDQIDINSVSSKEFDLNKLRYYENNIYVEVFVPNYKNVDSIQYYYYLEGGSEEWIPMNSNSLTLSNLSTGKYVLKLKARTNNGFVGEETKIEFNIIPPLWVSNYAKGFYIVIVALIIFLVIYNNKLKLRSLDNMVRLRTRELDEEMLLNKELYEKIIQLEKGKNNYLINLSHELRTPLNVIYTTEQLIRELNKNEEGIGKDAVDKYMLIMRNNTKRLLKIINDLIDTSKIEHGSYNINIQSVNIIYVIEEAALSLSNYIKEKGVDLIIDPEIEEKIIEADPNEIERCIVNIVNNAYKFTEVGGFIKINIIDLDERVKIEIIDNGIGIDKKNQELIFNRFNQVVDPNAETKKGSGLGLTITKKIIDLHHGTIEVESKLGEGSKFIIILPVKQPKEEK